MRIRFISSLVFLCVTCVFGGIGSAQRHDARARDLDITLFGPAGSRLLEMCSEPPVEVGDVVPVERLVKGASNNGMCAGYIAGVNDSQMMQGASGRPPLYCLPSGVQIDQMAKVVRKYLQDNPAELHLPGVILVRSALEQAFPCHN